MSTMTNYDVADYLRTEGDRAAYLDAWLKHSPDDAAGIVRAKADVARAANWSSYKVLMMKTKAIEQETLEDIDKVFEMFSASFMEDGREFHPKQERDWGSYEKSNTAKKWSKEYIIWT